MHEMSAGCLGSGVLIERARSEALLLGREGLAFYT